MSLLHPLIERLVQTPGAQAVSVDSLPTFLERCGEQVLYFGGDPVRFPEGLDVAVVLPEIVQALQRPIHIGVVPRGDETALARRFGVVHWPSLVFLRDGQYLGCVSGMRDWDVFLQQTREVLAATPSRPPSVGIAVVADATTDNTCH